MPRIVALRALLVAAIVSSFTVVAAASSLPSDGAGGVNAQPQNPDLAPAFAPIGAADPVVLWMVDQVKEDTVEQYAGDLSGAWPVTIRGSSYRITQRYTWSGPSIQQATYYVGDHLRARGLTVEEHQWGPATAPNVIGEKRGVARPGDIYMVTAHLDDVPVGAAAPGADDNASGSTAVLVAADVLSQFSWNCTLRFALWTGEEQGLMGSDAYAQRSKNLGENILGVLNLDMIAWNTPGTAPDIDLHAEASMPHTVDLADQMASVITAYGLNLIPEVRTDGTDASDHSSFWNKGYNAILGIEDYYPDESDFDPYYHSANDTLDTLNLGYFTEYVKAAVGETAHMAGCLVTGTLQGRVVASHDNSPITNAEIRLKDDVGREYGLHTGADGRYSQAVPPGTYAATISAYGYDVRTTSGIAVSAITSATAEFVLSAATPVAAVAGVSLDAGAVRLSWLHVSPDTSYQLRRSTIPYFDLAVEPPIATLEANHPPAANETLTYRDAESAAGDARTNHFYVVLGLNAAGSGAPSRRMGEFDFKLDVPPGPGG